MSTRVQVCVSGKWACFTRPEYKAERVSYPVITPSTARGILEAICWKPAISWTICEIAILKPVRTVSWRRNELDNKISTRNAITWMNGTADPTPFFIDDHRQQRSSTILRDVAYRVTAHFELTDRAGPEDNIPKFLAMFERRLANGSHFHQPYLGCREFPATVEAYDETVHGPPLDINEHLGMILYDMVFATDGQASPRFFAAEVRGGVMKLPAREEVMP